LIKAANLIAAPYNWVLTNHDSLGLLTIILRASEPAKYVSEGFKAISKILMGTKVNKCSIGFSVSTESKLCDTRSYDIISHFTIIPSDIL